jgi:hypothetical protein
VVATKAIKYGILEIFNTDQGNQFTNFTFANILKVHQIKIFMDGKGCMPQLHQKYLCVQLRLWKAT